MSSDSVNQSGQGSTGAGDQAPSAESLLSGAPAGGGAADQGKAPAETKPAGDSLLAAPGKEPAKEAAKTEEKKPAPPEKYEFKTPEGVQIDAAILEKATPIFKDLGLSQDAAQKLVDFQAAQQVEAAKAFNEQVGKWKAETKSLPESDKLLGDAKLFLDSRADPATQALIAGSWMGSHPGIIKLLASAGKLLREDPLHEGRASGPSPSADPAQAMFGDMLTKK